MDFARLGFLLVAIVTCYHLDFGMESLEHPEALSAWSCGDSYASLIGTDSQEQKESAAFLESAEWRNFSQKKTFLMAIF